ncbi:NAD(+) synthase [Calorimonas adulescens]|uniref:Glutamine-dependent NAD(+) synthetase n=1 Tax=Calorimonas adulescens TaxID=2606906 RepID=A0A5D8QDY1_9THEO|nr:NAD(+) synthase [Calorimonas adulescens]TZE82712.1 NAD(+) synthase [Calorimonas adulescens]
MVESFGFIKVASASPVLKVANTDYNICEIEKLMREADARGARIIAFPELCITGYTCNDLFLQKQLLERAKGALFELSSKTKDLDILAVVSLPLLIDQRLYDCAAVIQRGQILGIVPKIFLPNYKEFYEKRWFTSGYEISREASEIRLWSRTIPFGNLLFKNEEYDITLGIEICEDLWATIPPSSYLALSGANIIVNPSASNELVAKAEYRRKLIEQQSARCISGYIYAGAGIYESSTDLVFSGHCLIAENGIILEESKRFNRGNTIIYSEIDVDRLSAERQFNKTFADNYDMETDRRRFKVVEFEFTRKLIADADNFDRKVHPYPFVPSDPDTVDRRCEEIFNIQTAGLAKRIEHTGAKKAVIGISGGLDSTLALLVTVKTFDLLGISRQNIEAITMPGFGTTDMTYNNAVELMKLLNVNMREIDIKPACLQHMKDIGHDPEVHDITYENLQARERTQILMDIANKVEGLVVGTGDLSELALGWATYNGDHMSMYSVNCGVPKTLVRFLVKWIADNVVEENTRKVLYKIIDTPISPELLPPDEQGRIRQKTEDKVGPYELHDFFLFYVVRYGMAPRKVLFLANMAFKDKYEPKTIRMWLKKFYHRFFSQQFKRSALPDGPKVGSISLSPRGDWRMPSDADSAIWIKDLEGLM